MERMYCVPTSATNWINYRAKHGYPFATPNPVNSPQEKIKIMADILTMGAYMKTDPVEGTNSDNAFVKYSSNFETGSTDTKEFT